jgi:hypothetical protein
VLEGHWLADAVPHVVPLSQPVAEGDAESLAVPHAVPLVERESVALPRVPLPQGDAVPEAQKEEVADALSEGEPVGQWDTVPQDVKVGDRENVGDPENELLTVAQGVPLRELVGEPEGKAQEDPVGASVGEGVEEPLSDAEAVGVAYAVDVCEGVPVPLVEEGTVGVAPAEGGAPPLNVGDGDVRRQPWAEEGVPVPGGRRCPTRLATPRASADGALEAAGEAEALAVGGAEG